MTIVTVRVQSRKAGVHGRTDKTDFFPVEVADSGGVSKLIGEIESALKKSPESCMSAAIHPSYAEKEAIIIEYTRGYAKLDEVSTVVERVLANYHPVNPAES